MTLLGGIRSLADRYDTFVIDLWGTLHNGIVAYPGAAEALKRLKDKGKTIGLLSNAPRRAALAVDMLEGMGIGRDLYDVILTSGESVFRALSARSARRVLRCVSACAGRGGGGARSASRGRSRSWRSGCLGRCGGL